MKTKKISPLSIPIFEVSIAEVISKRIKVGLLMFFSGVLLLFVVGFAQFSGNIIHNAAHDTRHASGFPCH